MSRVVPSHCGASFSANHVTISHHSGLTFIRHNELRDLITSWLHEVCHDVTVEPPSVNSRDDTRGHIQCQRFLGQDVFLILGCFIPTHLAITRLTNRWDLCSLYMNLKRNESMETIFKV